MPIPESADPLDAFRTESTLSTESFSSETPNLRERSVALRQRYRDSHDRVDIDAAVYFAERALVAAGQGGRRPSALADLANALRVRFVGTGSQTETRDIDEAVKIAEQAVSSAADLGKPRPVFWSVLSLASRTRYLSTQQLHDIDRAVTAARNAVDLADPNEPDARRLGALATNLRLRYARTGRIADANDAVTYAEEAVAATPERGPARAARLSILATCRGSRYRGTRQIEDIDRSISAGREALDIPDPHPRDRKNRWANLATALRLRAERTDDDQDLDEAVTAARAALVLTSRLDPQHTSIVGTLASTLGTRYQHKNDRTDVDEALSLIKPILNDEPSGAGANASRHADYATLLRLRAAQEHDLESATSAVSYAVRATQLVPTGSELTAHIWSALGSVHLVLYEITGDLSAAEAAVSSWRQASRSPGSPSTRLFAAYSAGKTAYRINAFDDAAAAFDAGVSLLPSLAWAGLTRTSQEDALRRFQIVTGSAAAAWLAAGSPVQAVEALERGRSVLWNERLTLRSDNSKLAAAAPDLAITLADVAQQLAGPDPDAGAFVHP